MIGALQAGLLQVTVSMRVFDALLYSETDGLRNRCGAASDLTKGQFARSPDDCSIGLGVCFR
jgi:hypothetical protein